MARRSEVRFGKAGNVGARVCPRAARALFLRTGYLLGLSDE
jgi:hypothetical protein